MPSGWRRLRLQQKDLPPLLFQYTWSSQGYELYMTDLTVIWSERLPHKAIMRQAEENATTIDPSEGPEQLEVLLAKIGEALRGDGGSAVLNSGSQGDSLELTISTKLPAPLKPLTWSLSLLREPSSSLTSQLLLPLLKDEATWESRQRFLLDQLKQKDWVLGKLFDRIEALGVDLGTVFPSAAGLRIARKGSTRSEAAKFIKGITPFDQQTWLAESGGSPSDGSGLAANVVHEILGSDSGRDLERLRPPQDQWWRDLRRRSETTFVQDEETKASREDHPAAQEKEPVRNAQLDSDQGGYTAAESGDEEFLRQESPRLKTQDAKPITSPPKPKTKKKSPSQPPTAAADEATASESEPEPKHELAPRRRPTPRVSSPSKPAAQQLKAQEHPKKARGGLGVIGGKKKEEKEPERLPSPTAHPPEATKPGEDYKPSQSPPTKTKQPTKLGMIGGKSKAKAKAEERAEAPPSRVESGTPSKRARPTPAVETDQEAALPKETAAGQELPKKEISPAAGGPSAAAAVAPAPETETERANRKREELKRQLEAQSKAPTKKKRRF